MPRQRELHEEETNHGPKKLQITITSLNKAIIENGLGKTYQPKYPDQDKRGGSHMNQRSNVVKYQDTAAQIPADFGDSPARQRQR